MMNRLEQKYPPAGSFEMTDPDMNVGVFDRRKTRRNLNETAKEEATKFLFGETEEASNE